MTDKKSPGDLLTGLSTLPLPSWRLVCHACGHIYPEGTALAAYDCCAQPKVHVYYLEEGNWVNPAE